MFYEIEVVVWSGREGHTTETTSRMKKIKIFNKEELINEAVQEVDNRIITRLNHQFDDCAFDILAAYRKHGYTFWGRANIRNRITGQSKMIYRVKWEKDHWNLEMSRWIPDRFTV